MSTPLLESCIYTILRPDRLAEAASLRGPSTFALGKRMVSALKLHQEATDRSEDLPILFGDATDCSKLIYWGRLAQNDVGEDDTHITVFAIVPLRRGHRPQELILESTGEPIADGFIRAYAICKTPKFIK